MKKNTLGTRSPAWLSESRKIVLLNVALSLLAVTSFGLLTYVLPWLVTVIWNLISFIVGGVILRIILLFIRNTKFWRGIKHFSDSIVKSRRSGERDN
ncbi:MAG: hypothetical protein ABI151_08845 [Chitinophagaceae bacterium]